MTVNMSAAGTFGRRRKGLYSRIHDDAAPISARGIADMLQFRDEYRVRAVVSATERALREHSRV
uniref:Uncharacterized protein n=1 Tax=Hyaloperonospora arabidopsidis (strain Emoy2) TaxID=559515 RepID=M4BRT7_HYAAE